jgi:CO dehydrogenase/acetyl-CoA synthase beta subunit
MARRGARRKREEEEEEEEEEKKSERRRSKEAIAIIRLSLKMHTHSNSFICFVGKLARTSRLGSPSW